MIMRGKQKHLTFFKKSCLQQLAYAYFIKCLLLLVVVKLLVLLAAQIGSFYKMSNNNFNLDSWSFLS